jgi:hypothetical protein
MNSSEVIKEWERAAEALNGKLKIPLKTQSLKLVMFSNSDLGKQTIQGIDLMGSSAHRDPSIILKRVQTKLNYKPTKGVITKANLFYRFISFFFHHGNIIKGNNSTYWVKSKSELLANLDRELKIRLLKYPNIYLESNQKKSLFTLQTSKLIVNMNELLEFQKINDKLIRFLK